MNKEKLLARISINPRVLVGQPVIRGTRLSVTYILGRLASGSTMEEILGEYDGLEPEDIRACLLYAQLSLDATSVVPVSVEHA